LKVEQNSRVREQVVPTRGTKMETKRNNTQNLRQKIARRKNPI
jgi:hypothetical protein